MAKKAATFRLEEASLAWVSEYAEKRSGESGRKVGQAEVIEMALASFRDDCEGGVPDLPEPQTATEMALRERDQQVATPRSPREVLSDLQRAQGEYRAAAWARQAKLNAGKGRAS